MNFAADFTQLSVVVDLPGQFVNALMLNASLTGQLEQKPCSFNVLSGRMLS